jgi:uroporphyrin-3 C-methyltransferase
MSESTSKEVAQPKSERPSRSYTWIHLLIVVGLAGLGAQLMLQNQRLKTIVQQQHRHQSELAVLGQKTAGAGQKLSLLSSEQSTLKASQQSMHDTLTRMTEYTQADWLIAESAYLGNLAVARLETLKDVSTAIKQLEYAQARLSKLSDPTLLTLKERLSKDIGALEAVQSTDWEKVWVSLGTLSDSLERLPFQVEVSSANNDTVLLSTEEQKSWRTHLASSWDEIKSLVKVRRQSDSASLPLVTTSEKQHYLYSMQFLIEEARWAVINRHPKVYSDALQLLGHRLTAQFEMEDPQTQAFAEQLAQLQTIDLEMTLPDLSHLIRLFDQVQSRRQGGA